MNRLRNKNKYKKYLLEGLLISLCLKLIFCISHLRATNFTLQDSYSTNDTVLAVLNTDFPLSEANMPEQINGKFNSENKFLYALSEIIENSWLFVTSILLVLIDVFILYRKYKKTAKDSDTSDRLLPVPITTTDPTKSLIEFTSRKEVQVVAGILIGMAIASQINLPTPNQKKLESKSAEFLLKADKISKDKQELDYVDYLREIRTIPERENIPPKAVIKLEHRLLKEHIDSKIKKDFSTNWDFSKLYSAFKDGYFSRFKFGKCEDPVMEYAIYQQYKIGKIAFSSITKIIEDNLEFLSQVYVWMGGFGTLFFIRSISVSIGYSIANTIINWCKHKAVISFEIKYTHLPQISKSLTELEKALTNEPVNKAAPVN
jgi:hypothetical protein